MAVVISDTGPLLALAGIGQLTVLESLFSSVIIPESVWLESQAKTDDTAKLIENAVASGWLSVETLSTLSKFPVSLGDGEQQAMQLALNLSESLLIMDDRLARREALHRGISFIGTARVAWLAEKQGLVTSAHDLLTAMAEQGYFISTDLLLKFK